MRDQTRPSLRRVLLFAIAGASVGAVVLTAVIGVGLTRLGAEQRTIGDLTSEAGRIAEVASGLPCTGPQRPDRLARELGPGARFIPDDAPRPLERDAPASGRAVLGGRDVYYASQRTTVCGRPGRLFVVRPASDVPALPSGLGVRILAAAAIALLGSSALAYALARRLSRPLRDLAHAARAFAVPDAPSASDPREVAELKSSLGAMVSDLKESRDREKAFLLSVSHELRTPLTAIRGYSEALADGTARRTKHAGEVMLAESRRLERLVSDLLDLGRIEAGEFSIEKMTVDLDDIAASVVESLRPVAKSYGVALALDGPDSSMVHTDPDRAHQVIANLVENGLRVTPEGGRVSVEVSDRAVVIRDEGPGLPADDLAHAFERFYLWRKYRGDRPVGSGLGLAIVGELVEKLGARVAVDSDENGTRFEVRFDVAG